MIQITFGVIKGYLYRVHKFATISGDTAPKAKEVSNDIFEKIQPYLDGLHCFDEICTRLQMSDKDVMSALKGHAMQIIHK